MNENLQIYLQSNFMFNLPSTLLLLLIVDRIIANILILSENVSAKFTSFQFNCDISIA